MIGERTTPEFPLPGTGLELAGNAGMMNCIGDDELDAIADAGG